MLEVAVLYVLIRSTFLKYNDIYCSQVMLPSDFLIVVTLR